jgi:hypothetical protein
MQDHYRNLDVYEGLQVLMHQISGIDPDYSASLDRPVLEESGVALAATRPH